MVKSLIFIRYSKSNHCFTLSLRYMQVLIWLSSLMQPMSLVFFSLNYMSLNVDFHEMSTCIDIEIFVMNKGITTHFMYFQDFLWQLRRNCRFTMTTVLCAGKGWTLQENYPAAISFISMYYFSVPCIYCCTHMKFDWVL